MMIRHIFIDKITANTALLITGKNKFFAKSISSPSFDALQKDIKINIPDIQKEGVYELELILNNEILFPAIKVAKWLGNDFPTIIYHHGNQEQPTNFNNTTKNSFAAIFINTKKEIKANLIVVRAPFHNNSLMEYQQKMTDLRNFTSMISVSVKINEEIISLLRKKSKAAIFTCGISLGGWVTNLHRSFYNSSNAYIPLLAGTFLGELFITSKYKKLTSKLALNNSNKLRNLLNFNDSYKLVTEQNVFPLLARYDQFVEYDIQKLSYEGYILKTIEFGHITGSLETKKSIRKHIIEVLTYYENHLVIN